MKAKRSTIMILVALPLIWSCDQNKSGPVDPVATPADTAKEAPASKGEVLYKLAGPAAAVTTGSEQQIELVVTPVPGFKINKLFDWNFEFHPADGVELGAPTVGMEQVKLEDSKAVIPVKIKATAAGEHTLNATANFSICNDDKCELYRDREISFKMAATDG